MTKKKPIKAPQKDWAARALETQAKIVHEALTRVPQTLDEIRDRINLQGHDFTDAHVLAGLNFLADDDDAQQAGSGRWLLP